MVRRTFYWAFGIGVAIGAFGCGSDEPPASVISPLDGAGGVSGGGGEGSDDSPYFAGSTGLITDEPDAAVPCYGANCTGDGGLVGTSCGNRVRNEGEQCDDGNSIAGDGCNGVCNLEPFFDCEATGEACTSTISCGDGFVGGVEACDDDNTEPNDGCSPSCSVEVGFGCTTAPSGVSTCVPVAEVECGDGVISAGEQCDDSDAVPEDGCSATCQLEPRFACPVAGDECELIEFCGDGFLRDGEEQCDDGNLSPVDGCDGACNLLPNFVCPVPGELCRSTIVCGDSLVTGNETCDDGETNGQPVGGDGCSAICRAEGGFSCNDAAGAPAPGPCEPVAEERCGDSALAPTEFCDDGNTRPNDGCSAACRVEPGFDCPSAPGNLCVRVARCGDRLVNVAGEQCDDGETNGQPVGGDGCTANCRREALFSCPAAGGPCTSDVDCGDGLVNGGETCDDRNIVVGDGCDLCELEPGFVCPAGGVCRAVCADGIRAGGEQCDDGDTQGNDGCGPDCRLEQGFACVDATGANADPEDPDVCRAAVCGQLGREGTEQCDDGNIFPYDGCFECRNEPCRNPGTGFECTAVCGDGLKFPIEDCDDGNTLSGDGCSAVCDLEEGFECEDEQADLGESIDLPVVFRDFNGAPAIGAAGRHPQFQINPVIDRRLPSIVQAALGANGKPVYNPAYVVDGRAWSMDGPSNGSSNGTATLNAATIATRFGEWYTTVPGTNFAFVQFLTLGVQEDGSFQFQDNSFFPINGAGFGNFQNNNNFHFTSEVRQAFVFDSAAPPPTLTFRGDDDVWVFVNGVLTVDLGGIHSQLTGRVVINGANSQVCEANTPGVDVANFDQTPGTFCRTVNIPLDPLDVNEIAVFQAERNVTESNYTLTLRGFDAPITSCESVCGDGVLTADEACDLGFDAGEPLGANNTGAYETCDPNCTLTARCGDNVINRADGEECDNGVNTSTRLVVATDCAPGCDLPPSCGDGDIDSAFEDCDDGPANESPGTYDACGTDCALGPFCGDGRQQVAEGEECDTGANNGSDGSNCLADCTLRCGNGELDQGEECDDGLAANDGEYEGCNANCTLAGRCGDAVPDATEGEACDDGLNNGDFGKCGPRCQPGPFCGDGTTQAQFGELCDQAAANSATAYGLNLCTNQCRPAPFCGNQAVDLQFREVCDDGVNSGLPGSCATDCRSAIPLPTCGDGNVDASEQCDNGTAGNAQANGSCDVRCRNACGNGIRGPNEQCDDGVNNGSYGTCNPNCTLAPFCGDGALAAPPEACDEGSSNLPLSLAYGDGVCAATCAVAPRCGDGRVDVTFGEACDGSPSCTSACNLIR